MLVANHARVIPGHDAFGPRVFYVCAALSGCGYGKSF